MSEFDPILAFKDKLDFKKAFKWTVTKILQFLKAVADKPADYGAPTSAQADLKRLYEKIDLLKPKNLGDTSQWSDAKWRDEKVNNMQILRSGNNITPLEKIKWTPSGIEQDFFLIFDLLGAFLSLMGPAPDPKTATAKKFYLPLVVIYARWINALCQFPSLWRPAVAQITWVSKDKGKTWYFALGASIGGVPFNRGWKEKAGRKRLDYIKSIFGPPYNVADPWGKSITLDNQVDEKGGTNFGNCGETYPFLYALADREFKGDSYGIALLVGSTVQVDNQPAKTEYAGAEYWDTRFYWQPCRNCKQLQRWYRFPDYALVNGVVGGVV